MKESADVQTVRENAEQYYRNGDFYCSEAIVKAVRDAYELDYSDDVIKLASGFTIGVGGSGCMCGAIVGGVMAIGMIFGISKARGIEVDRAMRLSKDLHNFFLNKKKKTCCRVLTKGIPIRN